MKAQKNQIKKFSVVIKEGKKLSRKRKTSWAELGTNSILLVQSREKQPNANYERQVLPQLPQPCLKYVLHHIITKTGSYTNPCLVVFGELTVT